MNGLAILAAFGVAFGLGNQEFRRLERVAAADIAAKLEGPDKTVRVHAVPNGLGILWGELKSAKITASNFSTRGLPLFTEPERSKAGKIGTLQIELRDFVLGNLAVERLSASIPDCRFDLGLALSQRKIRLSKSGVGTGSVTISEKALEDWILRKFHEIKRVSVRVDRDVVWVEGYGEFLIAKTEFQVIARLEPKQGTQLELVDARVYFGWRRTEEQTRKVLLDTLNPVVDLNKDLRLQNAITVETIRLRGGKVVAEGITRIPVLPQP